MLRFCSTSGASSSRSSSRRAVISRSVSGSACTGDALQVGTVAGQRAQCRADQVLTITTFSYKAQSYNLQPAFRIVSATSSGRRNTVPPTRTTTPAARRASHRRPAASGDPAAPLPTADALQQAATAAGLRVQDLLSEANCSVAGQLGRWLWLSFNAKDLCPGTVHWLSQ